MEIIAKLPMMPPAMAPACPPECKSVEGPVGVALPAEDVYTPEGPKTVPGPYSGLSITNVGVRPQRVEKENSGGDAHHRLGALSQNPNNSPSEECLR